MQNRTNYKNGKQHGLSEWFEENGKFIQKNNYKNGNKDSPFEYFDEDGQLKFDNDFDDEIPF